MLPDKKNVVISNVMRELRDKNKEKIRVEKRWENLQVSDNIILGHHNIRVGDLITLSKWLKLVVFKSTTYCKWVNVINNLIKK